jgi:uncharacterized membrane protein YjjB (DUF3815 family)
VTKWGAVVLALFLDIVGVVAICGVVHKGLMTYTMGIIWANVLGSVVVSALADSLTKEEGE